MTQSSMLTGAAPLAVFRHRSFRSLWASQLLSTVGHALTTLMAGIVVFHRTGSAASMGLVMVVSAVATLGFGLAAGVAVDRSDRKRVLWQSNLARAALLALVPTLVHANIAWLFVLVALASGLGQFVAPATDSLLPEIASEEELSAATTLIGISAVGALAVGSALAGVLASWASVSTAFYLNAAILVAAAALVLGLAAPRPPSAAPGGLRAIAANVQEGFTACFCQPVLRSLFVIMAIRAVTYGLFAASLLPFTVRALHAPDFVYGLQEALVSVGFVAGSLVLAVLADRLREGQWIVLGLFAVGILMGLYSVTSSVAAALLLAATIAAAVTPLGYARRILVQRNTVREVRGRVASTFYVAWTTLYMVGMACVGLADVVPVRIVIFVVAAVTVANGVLAAVLPGLGQPRAEWRRAVQLLRGAAAAPGLLRTRPAAPADFEGLARHLEALARFTPESRRQLAARALVADAPAGTTVLRKGDPSDAAYFVMVGRVVAGWDEEGGYRPLEILSAGDFFGEIAALRGVPRTANVVAEEDTRLLQVPASVLQTMMDDPVFRRLVHAKLRERVDRMGLLEMPEFGVDARMLAQASAGRAEPAPARAQA